MTVFSVFLLYCFTQAQASPFSTNGLNSPLLPASLHQPQSGLALDPIKSNGSMLAACSITPRESCETGVREGGPTSQVSVTGTPGTGSSTHGTAGLTLVSAVLDTNMSLKGANEAEGSVTGGMEYFAGKGAP